MDTFSLICSTDLKIIYANIYIHIYDKMKASSTRLWIFSTMYRHNIFKITHLGIRKQPDKKEHSTCDIIDLNVV